MNLQAAYNNYFRNVKTGFPKFKSKKHDKNTYTTNNTCNNIRIENDKLRLPKLGFVKIILHRQIPKDYLIKSCTLTKTQSGKYFVSILTEYYEKIDYIQFNKNNILGLDMDMKNLYTDSQGMNASYPRYYRKILEKLRKEQKKLSNRKKGSKNRDKQRLKVATLHEKATNQRKDFLHKLSRKLADDYDAIIIEDLNMQKMKQTLNLGKSIMDNAWGKFTIMLNYKLNDRGKQLIKIDKWFPSSKTCNECGYINHELTLNDRIWICPNCGNTIERDYNAAKNIRDEGIKILNI